jgi:hypothetical protein
MPNRAIRHHADTTASATSANTRRACTSAVADSNRARHSCAKHPHLDEVSPTPARRRGHRPKRDCHHPRARHEHGTRAAYVRDTCRCHACTATNTAESHRAHRARSFGRWQPYIDAGPVHAHLHALRRAGIGVDQIAKLAGLSGSHVRGLIYTRRDGTPPHQRVRPDTARKILALHVDDTNRAGNATVDATGTRRRLQALVAAGYTQARLAAALGRTPASLRRTMRASHVTAHTARAVRDLDERLWNSQPPSATKAQRLASDAARAHAAQRGWRPRLAWDDIENDAEPNPDQPDSSNPDDLDEIAIERAIAGDTQVRLTDAEQREVVRQLTERGRSIRVIAELLATSKRTVSRRRRQISAA